LLLLLGLLGMLGQGCLSLSLLLLLAVLFCLPLDLLLTTLLVSFLSGSGLLLDQVLLNLIPLIHPAHGIVVRGDLGLDSPGAVIEDRRIKQTSRRFLEAFLLIGEIILYPNIRKTRH
jgi:hypothetical protein